MSIKTGEAIINFIIQIIISPFVFIFKNDDKFSASVIVLSIIMALFMFFTLIYYATNNSTCGYDKIEDFNETTRFSSSNCTITDENGVVKDCVTNGDSGKTNISEELTDTLNKKNTELNDLKKEYDAICPTPMPDSIADIENINCKTLSIEIKTLQSIVNNLSSNRAISENSNANTGGTTSSQNNTGGTSSSQCTKSGCDCSMSSAGISMTFFMLLYSAFMIVYTVHGTKYVIPGYIMCAFSAFIFLFMIILMSIHANSHAKCADNDTKNACTISGCNCSMSSLIISISVISLLYSILNVVYLSKYTKPQSLTTTSPSTTTIPSI